jgi:hypothetical protein
MNDKTVEITEVQLSIILKGQENAQKTMEDIISFAICVRELRQNCKEDQFTIFTERYWGLSKAKTYEFCIIAENKEKLENIIKILPPTYRAVVCAAKFPLPLVKQLKNKKLTSAEIHALICQTTNKKRWKTNKIQSKLLDKIKEQNLIISSKAKNYKFKKGFVYFVFCNDEFMQVGYTNNIHIKLLTLQINNPYKLSGIYIEVENPKEFEQQIYKFLKECDLHYRGKWFYYDEEVIEELKEFFIKCSYNYKWFNLN